MTKLTPEASRAARAILNWTTADLAKAAGMSATTLSKVERGEDVREESLAKIVQTFEANGVEILNGDAPGARLIRRRP